jgi:hypothetical protein
VISSWNARSLHPVAAFSSFTLSLCHDRLQPPDVRVFGTGHSVVLSLPDVFANLGFCPQFDGTD